MTVLMTSLMVLDQAGEFAVIACGRRGKLVEQAGLRGASAEL